MFFAVACRRSEHFSDTINSSSAGTRRLFTMHDAICVTYPLKSSRKRNASLD